MAKPHGQLVLAEADAAFLVKYHAIPARDASKGNGRSSSQVKLSAKATASLFSGSAVVRLLGSLSGTSLSIATGTSAKVRLQTWGEIASTLAEMRLGALDAERRTLIVAGDAGELCSLLTQIRLAHIKSSQAPKLEISGPNVLLSVREEDVDRCEDEPEAELEASRSCGELFIRSMNQPALLGVRPKQAAALLGQNSKYLARIMVFGIKGSFEGVLRWLARLQDCVGQLVDLMASRGGDCGGVLSAISPALFSHSEDVAALGCRLLSALAKGASGTAVEQETGAWFSESGLVAVAALTKRHPTRQSEAVGVFEHFVASGVDLGDVLSTRLSKVLPGALSRATFLHTLVAPFRGSEHLAAELGRGDTMSRLVRSIAPLGDGSNSQEARIGAMGLPVRACGALHPARSTRNKSTLLIHSLHVCIHPFGHSLCELWAHFAEEVESEAELPKLILQLLKKAVRDRSLAVQVFALAALFDLLGTFARENLPFAPFIYKTLIFSFIEHHGNEVIREFIMVNLACILRDFPSVPVGILVEPLVKQASLHGYSNVDFDFFLALAKHQRLGLRHGLLLLDLLGKICLNDPIYGRVASVPLLIIANRYAHQAPLLEYVQRYAKVALSMFVHIEVQQTKQLSGGRVDNDERSF